MIAFALGILTAIGVMVALFLILAFKIWSSF